MLRARTAAVGALALLLGGAAVALEGRVVDAETGEPLAGVTLTVVGGPQSARTDGEGRFFLVPDPRPPFDLLAVLPGGHYAKPIRVDAPPADGPLIVEVRPTRTETVTVTAGAAPGIETAPAAGTTVVTREDVAAREPRNLTEALETVPGVQNVSEGHAAVPAVRGLAQGRSLVLIDGARVTAERRVGPSATFVVPFVLEGVEVARGPGSVAYGSDAFGGVILARTRRPEPGGEPSFAVSGTVGTGVPQTRLGVEFETGLGDRAGLLLSGHFRDFDAYDSPEGEVRNSGSRDRGILAGYTHLLRGGLLSVAVQADEGRDIERPRDNSDVVRFYYPREDSLRVTASYETGPVLGFDSTELSLFFGDKRIVTDQDRHATPTTPRSIERADISANDFGVRADLEQHVGQVRLEYGVDVHGRHGLEAEDVTVDFDLSGAPVQTDVFTTIEDARRIDAGVYVSAVGAPHARISLSGGLRYDTVQSKNSGGFFGDRTVSNAKPSGFAAATFGAFGGFSATAQFARGFRDARLSDRFFRGVTGAGFITGNPDLEPETSDQLDLALRYSAGRWHPAVYAYHYTIDGLIERYEDQPDFFFFRNRGSAEIRGVELELVAELPRAVSLVVAAAVAEGEALDDGTPLDDIAPENITVQARKEFGTRGWVQVRTAWIGELDEPGPNEVALDARTVVDVSAGWSVRRDLRLQLVVRNLFDEEYLLTADDRSPLAPGTSAALSARYSF